MATIHLETFIRAPRARCFDLSRSIDLHLLSTQKTKEQAVAGITSGLIGLNESVTWEAVHLGIRQRMTTAITAMESPFHFRDEQVKGPFRYFKHEHYFETYKEGTLMIDTLEFSSPAGALGRWFDRIFLSNYLEQFLKERNRTIRDFAESDRWKSLKGVS